MILRHSTVIAALTAAAVAQQFSDATIAQVKQNLANAAKQSWELGTRAQALLELDASAYSVYSSNSVPPPSNGDVSSLGDVLAIAANTVNALPGPAVEPLVLGSGLAAGDPPSIGVAVLLANAVNAADPNTKLSYADAATGQLQYLLNVVPRTPDGAISHRNETVWLWSDFVYMVPPFLAYYGAVTQNTSLMEFAYTQCSLYRKYLADSSNMWQHQAENIAQDDTGHWSTGNGWAANGMLRVLATMLNSPYASQFSSEMDDLGNWAGEILDGVYPYLNSSTLLFNNYIDQPATFADASGTTLLAAATYRLALLRGVHTHVPQAETVRKGLVNHIDSNGWLFPVVNPENFPVEGSQSPEGQAFVLLLHSAWSDWVAAGSPGANAASPRAVVGHSLVVVMAMTILCLLW